MLLCSRISSFNFATTQSSRIHGDRITLKYPQELKSLKTFKEIPLSGKAAYVEVRKRKTPVRIDQQPIPLHDYMNFKKMANGNEVLLNLDNCENLRNGELISGLIELGRRDAAKEFDWNQHPIVTKCIKDLKHRIPRMNAKNVIQTPLLL